MEGFRVSIFPLEISQNISDDDILYKKEDKNNDSALLTNDSLLIMKHGILGSKKLHKIDVDDIYSFEKITGGQESRVSAGLKISLFGVALGLITIFIPILNRWLENLFFFIGIIAFVIGTHFILQSLIRIRPHTSIYIEFNKGKTHIAIVFPNIGNADAENLFNKIISARKLKKKSG